jgi:hypothetical protein
LIFEFFFKRGNEMKKIIFMVVAIMLTFGLFAQDKILVDGKASADLERIDNAMKSAGLDYEFGEVVPESEKDFIRSAVSVDEFIEDIEAMSTKSSTYIDGLMIIPIYQLVPTPSGYVFVWTGKVSAAPDIVGDDWNGVKHTKGLETHYVYNPNYAYQYPSVSYYSRVLCVQLLVGSWVYVPNLGWVMINVLSGDKVCGTASMNY